MSGTIGCIGYGHIGSALMNGFSKKLQGWKLCVCNRRTERLEALKSTGIKAMPDIESTVKKSDIIILAVKPHQMETVARACAPFMNSNKTICSVAAGISLAWLRLRLGNTCAIARCMPTTTALVGHGVFAFSFDDMNMTAEISSQLLDIFGKLGYCLTLDENKITAFSAYIGAGPAYVFAMMQGLAQAGLTLGFTRDQNQKMLCELMAGCAALAAIRNESFMSLRDDVCSPGGLTIAGINVLDRAGLSGIVVDAVKAAEKRGLEMDRENQ